MKEKEKSLVKVLFTIVPILFIVGLFLWFEGVFSLFLLAGLYFGLWERDQISPKDPLFWVLLVAWLAVIIL